MIHEICNLPNMLLCTSHVLFMSPAPVHFPLSSNLPISLKVSRKKGIRSFFQIRRCPVMIAQTEIQGESTTNLDGCGKMNLHFVSKIISVDGRSSDELRRHIERAVEKEGDPVRWAIVDADQNKGTCRVDAVVSRNTRNSETL